MVWGKTSTCLVTRSVRIEVFSVKVKETHREERHSRENLHYFLHRRRGKLSFFHFTDIPLEDSHRSEPSVPPSVTCTCHAGLKVPPSRPILGDAHGGAPTSTALQDSLWGGAVPWALPLVSPASCLPSFHWLPSPNSGLNVRLHFHIFPKERYSIVRVGTFLRSLRRAIQWK